MATNVRFFKIKHFDNYETDFKDKSISDIVGSNNFYEEAFYLNSNDGSLYLGNQKLSNAQEVQQLIENFEQLYDFQREITTTNTDGTVTTETIDYSDIDKGKAIRTIAIEELSYQLLSDKAEADFKTLQELGAWIEDHPESVAEMNLAIQNNAKDIDDIQLDIMRLDVQPDWNLENDQSHAYIKNKIPIKNGIGENAIVIGDGDATGKYSIAGGTNNKEIIANLVGSDILAGTTNIETSKSQGPMSLAFGAGNKAITAGTGVIGANSTAGCKGFYFWSINFSSKVITLSTNQKSLTSWTRKWTDAAKTQLAKWAKDDVISIVNDSKYVLCSTITAIDANAGTITVDKLPFTEVKTQVLTNFDDYAVTCPSKPDVGVVDQGLGAFSTGLENKASGSFSHTEGWNNLAAGDFAHVEGRDTKAGYAAHAEGNKTQAIGHNSHAEGASTTASGENGHAEGKNTQAVGLNSHAEGSGTVAEAYCSHAEGANNTASGNESHAEGGNNNASGLRSHAEGYNTKASGSYSHTEGQDTEASGLCSHSEGSNTYALGDHSHAEGSNTRSSGHNSHTEGFSTVASSDAAHAEGYDTIASGAQSHAEGYHTRARGDYSHTEGFYTTAIGNKAHAEGNSTNPIPSTITKETTNEDIITAWTEAKFALAKGGSSHIEGGNGLALGSYAHSEGDSSQAIGNNSHAEGSNTKAEGHNSHTEGRATKAVGQDAHAEGLYSKALSDQAHAEGYNTQASGLCSHSEGSNTIASGDHSHAEGKGSCASAEDSHAEGNYTEAMGAFSHAEGGSTKAKGGKSHSEGSYTEAIGHQSHAEGSSTYAFGENSHSEGFGVNILPETVVSGLKYEDLKTIYDANKFSVSYGKNSHIEGYQTVAFDENGHAEGYRTHSVGKHAHSEGNGTRALGHQSHAEGLETKAQGSASHSEGRGTIATADCQHVQGKYNLEDTNKIYAHILGNGTASAPNNAHAVDWNGNAWYLGDLYVGGIGLENTNAKKVATEQYVDNAINNINLPSFSSIGKSGEGLNSEIFNDYTNNSAKGDYSHIEGKSSILAPTDLNIDNAYTTWNTEKNFAIALGKGSHVEGGNGLATGSWSHVEGLSSCATGYVSHAEGIKTKAVGNGSHAEGELTEANGHRTHAEGYGTVTSNLNGSHVQGNYNIIDNKNLYLHIVGNGTSNSDRKNIHTIDKNGNAWFSGTIKIGGTDDSTGSEVALKTDISNLDSKINTNVSNISSLTTQVNTNKDNISSLTTKVNNLENNTSTDVVNLSSAQTITGLKTFSNSLKVGSATIKYSNGMLTIKVE